MFTLAIIVVTVVVSYAAFSDAALRERLIFEPFVVNARNEWYRFVTHAFLHADTMHLAVNMFVLYSFGSTVEKAFQGLLPGTGRAAFVLLYLAGAVWAALPGYRKHRWDPSYRSLGASGAVSAVLFSFILMFPFGKMGLMFVPFIDLPGWAFGGLYLAYEWYMDRKGGGYVAHDAHFHGALFGVVFTALLHPAFVPDLVAQFKAAYG